MLGLIQESAGIKVLRPISENVYVTSNNNDRKYVNERELIASDVIITKYVADTWILFTIKNEVEYEYY